VSNAIRVQADFDRLRALAAASGEMIVLRGQPTTAAGQLDLELRYATARSERYPADVTRQTRVRIALSSRYPFSPPTATVLTSIWHPNVYAAGVICLGTRWLPSEGLDLFVQRIARLLTFDSLLVNTQSAANRAAAEWYERTRRLHPQAFPSDRPVFEAAATGSRSPRMGWRDTHLGDARVTRPCPECARTLRLPAGRRGRVRCPGCGTTFEAVT
jgi:hypothetical protein